jgi:hypothetical protein
MRLCALSLPGLDFHPKTGFLLVEARDFGYYEILVVPAVRGLRSWREAHSQDSFQAKVSMLIRDRGRGQSIKAFRLPTKIPAPRIKRLSCKRLRLRLPIEIERTNV